MAIMDPFDTKAKASECRLIAASAQGERRAQLLALAAQYDEIYDAMLRLKANNESAHDVGSSMKDNLKRISDA